MDQSIGEKDENRLGSCSCFCGDCGGNYPVDEDLHKETGLQILGIHFLCTGIPCICSDALSSTLDSAWPIGRGSWTDWI